MSLVLSMETYDPALGENAARRIEVATRLTIGRGADNDLVLPDPQRHLSKTHCVISFDGSAAKVTDTSTNGVFLDNNAERLPRNVPVPISEGSILRFGGYQISVTAIAPAFVAAQTERPRPIADEHRRDAIPTDDGLLGDPLASPPMFHDPVSGLPANNESEPPDFGFSSTSSAPLIPDDIDLFIGDEPSPQWQGAAQPDHTPADQMFFAPPKVTSSLIPDDWDISEPPQHAGARGPDRSSPPHLGGAASARLDIPSTTPSQRPPPGNSRDGENAAVASFLAAVGLQGTTLTDAEKARVMQVAGRAFAAMTKGLSEILAARASTKQEFRIERTTIGATRNNPLKFAGSPEEALRVMLLGRTPGFLTAVEAVEEALGDIKGHQLAVLAGMQVALATVIERFDPEKLENRLDQRSLIEGLVPAARKARYWDLFKALYKEIATELEDDFQKAFGTEFARAYRKQLGKL